MALTGTHHTININPPPLDDRPAMGFKMPSTGLLINARDPSRTTALRNAFARRMRGRFNRLIQEITKAVSTEDVFGLLGNEPRVTVLQTPGPRRFAFSRDSRKVAAFMDWLDRQVKDGVLSVTEISQVGEGVERAWTNLYIDNAYRRGVARARYQMRRAGFDVPPLDATGGIDAAMGTLFHVDRVGLLYTRVFNELQGITAAMDQQISRILAEGLAKGLHPRTLARMMRATITGRGMGDLAITDRLGRFIPARRRAEMLARTEVIRAHASGQLQEFKNWRVEQVGVVAELQTAGDERVCPECSALENELYTIEEAQNIIPVHPNCRCIWLPLKREEAIDKNRTIHGDDE